MKTPLSFLFFCVISILTFSFQLQEQTQVDSTSIYYNRIHHPKSTDIVSLDDAILFFKKKHKKSLKNDSIIGAIHDLRTVTAGYMLQGRYVSAENNTVEALEIIDNQPINPDLKIEKSRISIELGRMYWSLKNYKQAAKYYNNALESAETTEDSISCHNNIGLVYLDWKKFKEAEAHLNTAYKKTIVIKDKKKQWNILSNIGFVEWKLGKSTGFKKMTTAHEMMLQKKLNLRDLFANTYNLTTYYIDHNDNQKARSLISLASKIADSIKNPLFKHKILGLNAQIYDDPNIREYQRLNDSISFAEKQIEHKYASQKYNYEKAEKEKIKANYKTNLWRIVGIVIVLISIFLFFYYKQRNRIEKAHERHRTEQTLSKKVHDEVGNDLFYLMTQIQSSPHEFLEQNGLKLLDGLNDIYGKARDISKHYTAVHTGPNYNDELLSLLNSFGSDHIKLIINKTEAHFWEAIDANKKEALYRVLQELLTNMKKHSDANFVAITFSKDSQNVHVKYVDNGIGVDLNSLTHKNGLHNVESRMAALKGSITFESAPNQGFKAFIKLSI